MAGEIPGKSMILAGKRVVVGGRGKRFPRCVCMYVVCMYVCMYAMGSVFGHMCVFLFESAFVIVYIFSREYCMCLQGHGHGHG